MWIYICVRTLTYVNAVLNHPRSALGRGSGEFPANLRLADLNFTRPPRRAFPAVSLGFCLSATQFPCFGYEGKRFPSLWGPVSLSTLLPPNSVSPISLAPTYPGPTQRPIFENEAWETGATVSHFVATGLYCSLGRSWRMIDKPEEFLAEGIRSHPTGREDGRSEVNIGDDARRMSIITLCIVINIIVGHPAWLDPKTACIPSVMDLHPTLFRLK
jgi:hypothetical protein